MNAFFIAVSVPVLLAFVAMVGMWARLCLTDGWLGARLLTVPARSLNWITGGNFFSDLDMEKLETWEAPFDLGVVFPHAAVPNP